MKFLGFELSGDPLADIKEPIEELSEGFNSAPVVSITPDIYISQYVIWMIIIAIITVGGILWAVKKVKVVPDSKIGGLIDWGYDAVCRNMGEGAVGHGYKKHIPFLATMFFFILITNIIGLIPGTKTPTGCLSVTWALSTLAFIYFNAQGFKTKGGLGYIKSIAPSGLPGPMVPIIWFLELFSLIIRWLTLAVRLYGNMFAGHMILGIFSIMTQFFILNAIAYGNVLVGLPAIAWFLLMTAMYALECLVAFLQAYVFTTLTAVYVGLAQSEH